MRAGKLRHRVAITRETRTADSFGQLTDATPETVGTVWAEIRPLSGKEMEIARQLRAETTHRIRMRRTYAVLPTDYLLFGSRRFNILEITDFDERGIELSILASEITTGGEL